MSQSQAIEARISNAVDVGDVVCAAVDAAFPRVRCSCDECPNEPAWSRELAALTDSLITDADAMLRARVTEVLATFAEAHPEATRA